MPDDSSTALYLYVLPWLQLHDQLTFGQVTVAPADRHLEPSDIGSQAARRIVATYRDIGGDPIRPALMWLTDSTPLGMTDQSFDDLTRHRMCLSAGLIMSNRYYDTAAIGGTTDTHVEGYFHRFTADAQHVSIYKRRREGQYLDGWPLDRITMRVPFSGSPAHQLNVDLPLLDALIAALGGASSTLSQVLERALPPFLQGNRLSEQTTILDDLVWIGAAFERLFEIATPIGENLAAKITTALGGFTETTTTWNNLTVAGNLRPDSGPWRKRWTREFYARRSSIHGGAAASSSWTDIFHGVIAAEVFGLAVKRLLEQDGCYTLTDADKLSMDALDERIFGLATTPGDPVRVWNDALISAGRRHTTALVADALEESGS